MRSYSLVPLHGLGGRQDLPIPLSFAVAGAAVAVLASFVILGFAWRTPRFRGNRAGWALPMMVTRTVDAGWFRWIVRGVGLAAGLYSASALMFGVAQLINPIFGVVYVLVWVGLVPISLLFGPVWRTLNPLRTLHLLVSRVAGVDPHVGLFALRRRLGVWPAAVGLFAFTWLERVPPDRVTRPVRRLS